MKSTFQIYTSHARYILFVPALRLIGLITGENIQTLIFLVIMDMYDGWDDFDSECGDLICDLSSTQLHHPVWSKDKSSVQRLLNTGMDIHARDGQGRDVLSPT